MTRQHETFEHTADLGVSARADSLAELFEALAEGVAGVICAPAAVRPLERRELLVVEEEDDREGLLVDFLWEVVAALEQHHFLVCAVEVRRLEARSLEAELIGEPYDPARHELRNEVKAVTWHQLLLAEHEGRWEGRVILDL